MTITKAFVTWEQETENRGRQEGRQEEKVGIVMNMLRRNLDLETIAEVTGLPIAQIQELQSQMNP